MENKITLKDVRDYHKWIERAARHKYPSQKFDVINDVLEKAQAFIESQYDDSIKLRQDYKNGICN